MDNFLDGIDGGLILMLIVYSGLASWIAARLTRSASDATAASRQALSESLDLLERLKRAQSIVDDPDRRRELQIMYARIEAEVADRADELNAVAELLHRRPSAQFVIIPRPRRMSGALWSALLIVCLYTGGAVILQFIRQFLIERTETIGSSGGLEQMLLLIGGGVALIALGLLFRMLAFRDYDRHIAELRERGHSQLSGGDA